MRFVIPRCYSVLINVICLPIYLKFGQTIPIHSQRGMNGSAPPSVSPKREVAEAATCFIACIAAHRPVSGVQDCAPPPQLEIALTAHIFTVLHEMPLDEKDASVSLGRSLRYRSVLTVCRA
jgi:hypothetical protein